MRGHMWLTKVASVLGPINLCIKVLKHTRESLTAFNKKESLTKKENSVNRTPG